MRIKVCTLRSLSMLLAAKHWGRTSIENLSGCPSYSLLSLIKIDPGAPSDIIVWKLLENPQKIERLDHRCCLAATVIMDHC